MFLDAAWRRELVHAARRLRKSSGFAVVAITTFAIGVGVNSAMFGIIDGLLFRPPPHVTEPDRVVRVRFASMRDSVMQPWNRANYPALEDLAAAGVLEDVAGYFGTTVSIGQGEDAFEADAMLVTTSFFRVLGVRAAAGTLPGVASSDTAAANAAVISHGFWERHFGGARDAIGAPLRVGTSTYTVAGVLPSGFAALQDEPVDLWIPMDESAGGYMFGQWRTNRGSFWLDAVGRLPASATAPAVEQRAAAVMQVTAQAERRAPAGIVTAPLVGSRASDKSREVRVSLWLAGVTAFVLLIACANIANLILARNLARAREYAVRLSLGATNWQLRRQLIADVIAVAVPGIAAAAIVGYLVRGATTAFLPADVPIARDLMDGRSLAVMAASGFVAILLVTIVSLAQVRPAALARALMTQTRDDRGGSAWARGSLIALQSALCVALLFSAGLFARSLERVLSLDLGVDMDRTVQISFNIPRGSRTPEERQLLYERALERLRAHPGIERAALAGSAPFQSGMGVGPFTSERGQEELWSGRESAYASAVGAGFFESVGAASLVGRDFTDTDRAGAPRVVIVNRNLATMLFPRGDALNQCVFLYESRECYRVVGILSGVWKMRALDRDRLALYTPLAQTEGGVPGALLVRTRGEPGPLLGQIRSTVQQVAADLPAVRIARASDLVDWEFRPWRLGATLFGAFSAIALVIAAVGLYGVVSFTATLRTREIGVRMALGARATHVIRIVSAAGLGAVITGLVVGSAAALVASRWVGDILYETSPRDPVVLGQTAGVLLLVAVVSVVVPVVRALRLAPAAVLRAE